MKVRRLSQTEKDVFGADLLVTVYGTDVAGFTDATAAPLFSAPNGFAVSLVLAVLDTPFAFSDGDVTACALILGDGDDDDRYLAAADVWVDGTPITKTVGTIATNRFVYTADDTVDAIFTLTITELQEAALSSCTAGQIRLYFSFENTNALPVT